MPDTPSRERSIYQRAASLLTFGDPDYVPIKTDLLFCLESGRYMTYDDLVRRLRNEF